MSFVDLIKKSVLEGISAGDISAGKILTTLGVSAFISVYIFFVYRFLTRNTFYNKRFNVSMSVISMVVSGIILAMQSSLVISLGMVGALSIVRFRTAIKDPMDLLFLFWSIGNGIICGAGLYKLAFLVSGVVTVATFALWLVPVAASPFLVVVNAVGGEAEADILDTVKRFSPKYQIDSKNLRGGGMDMVIEVRTKNGSVLVDALSALETVNSVSLLYHEGEVNAV